MNIHTNIAQYFNNVGNPLDQTIIPKERFLSCLKILSIATIIFPLFAGIVYGIGLGIEYLKGRINKKNHKTKNDGKLEEIRNNYLPNNQYQQSRSENERQTNHTSLSTNNKDNNTPQHASSSTSCNTQKSSATHLTEDEFLEYFNEKGEWTGPDKVYLRGDLTISRDQPVKSMPKLLHVTEHLKFENKEIQSTSLPQDLKVGGRLHLNDCTSLTSLPQRLKVGGDLYLTRCSSLNSLAQGLKVGGNLYLTFCSGLTSLSQGLEVGGDLDLMGCTDLTSLSQGLKVKGDLYLEDCTGLISLPQSLQVGGNLSLEGCTRLTSLPNSITELGYTSSSQLRIINLTGTGLSQEIIQHLRDSQHDGIQFYYSQQAETPTINAFPTMEEAIQFWAEKANSNKRPVIQVGQTELNNILQYLQRLTSTQEYKNNNTRHYLAQRVMDILVLMETDQIIRENAINLMFNAVSTCDDRIIEAFDRIELMVKIHEIENSDYTKEDLRALGKQFLMLEMVNEKVKEHITTLSFVDEIEVYLAFRIALKDRFQLPIKTSNMIFRNCAQISDDKLIAVGDTIEEEYSEDKLEEFLKTWSPWVEFLKKNETVPDYADLPIDDQAVINDDTNCPILQDVPKKPVSYKETIYDYDMFVGQYKASGKNPMNTSEEIDLKLLKRVENQ